MGVGVWRVGGREKRGKGGRRGGGGREGEEGRRGGGEEEEEEEQRGVLRGFPEGGRRENGQLPPPPCLESTLRGLFCFGNGLIDQSCNPFE